MSSVATLIFPHQLFRDHPAISPGRPVYLIEETLFFHQFRFHKKKLVLHRASMKAYAAGLKDKTPVCYIEAISAETDLRLLLPRLRREGIDEMHLADPVDDWLGRRLRKTAATCGLALVFYPSPNFINRADETNEFFETQKGLSGRRGNAYFMAEFYIAERKKRNWLLDDTGKPAGGKWSFDPENRKRLPASHRLPFLQFPKKNEFVSEAVAYVGRHFGDHFGDLLPLPGGGFYPVDSREADEWLGVFLSERLSGFGPYEDAMRTNDHFLFHSVLTPMLNIGLLDPAQVIRRMLSVAKKNEIPLPSVEGFLRQIAGWREFMRVLYEREGRKQRTLNYWAFSRKIPASLRSGKTGIVPVDAVIRKVFATGYAHHIERLMVLGNFMLLCEFHPGEVYAFFMECFIDAYDWVMVPNVYGMSQFADGGLMTTKPYFSASHYLLKMGDWERGPWEKTWDGLFWRFLSVHRNIFAKQPRWKMLLSRWDKIPLEDQRNHLNHAELFLEELGRSETGSSEPPLQNAPALF